MIKFLRNCWLIVKHAFTHPNTIMVLYEDGRVEEYDPKEYDVTQTVIIKRRSQ